MPVEIELFRGRGVAIIDASDVELVRAYSWSLHSEGYALASVGSRSARRYLYMHRLIMGDSGSRVIDHIDRDKLNNRRSNLRLATRGQNATHQSRSTPKTSRFRGVHLNSSGRWVASIGSGIAGKTRFIGKFLSEEEAARAYDRLAIVTYGEFATLNFLGGE